MPPYGRCVQQRSGNPLPWQDRPWGDVHEAWPLILEPTGLDEPTRPCLGGSSSPTVRDRARGHVIEQRQALALLRLPAEAGLGRPKRYLAWVLMRRAHDPGDFSSHIAEWWPAAPHGRTRPLELSLAGASPVHTTVRGDDERWTTAPVQVPASVLPGEPTTLVLTGAKWPAPRTLTMQAASTIGDYLDALR